MSKVGSLQSNLIESTITAFGKIFAFDDDSIFLCEMNFAFSVHVDFFLSISLQLQCAEDTSLDVQGMKGFTCSWEQLVDSPLRGFEE